MQKKEFSQYFEIWREADGNNPDGEFKEEVCFDLGEDECPISLGDGSYGSVYRGRTKGGQLVAIKILYDNFDIRPLSDLTPGERRQLLDPLVDKYSLYTKVDEDEEQSKKNKEDIIQRLSDALKPTEKEESGEKRYSFSEHQKKVGDIYNELQKTNNELPEFSIFWDELSRLASSTAVARFEKERSVTTMLRKSSLIKTEGRRAKASNIVDVIGGCSNFLSLLKKRLSDLEPYFSENIKVSDYVLVTERYDYSLKDLLERPREESPRGGYANLENRSHLLRSCEALMISQQVASGLQTLHNVKIPNDDKPKTIQLFHRDIKPANVFIRKDEGIIEAALGDLGSLPANETSLGNFAFGTDFVGYEPPDYAPGTRHYRSPEQKYFRDIADVQVVHLPPEDLEKRVREILSGKPVNEVAGEELETVLIVTDPKFKNTLIEKDDVVFFSKDENQETYLITQIIRPEGEGKRNERSGHVAYVLNKPRPGKDQKTQVEFYKLQQYRTDLFGIGALIYDIMTVGSSPEQFYESIQKFEGDSVAEVIRKYNALRGGIFEGENLDFAEIFHPFQNDNDPTSLYPDEDIIELILMCMLYQSKGTFYDKAQDEPHKASGNLVTAINKLYDSYMAKRLHETEIAFNVSLLVTQVDVNGTTIDRHSFQRRLDELQGLTVNEDLEVEQKLVEAINRLTYGAYYFRNLIGYMQKTIDDKPWLKTVSDEQAKLNEDPILQILPPFIRLNEDRTGFDRTTTLAVFPEDDLRNNGLDLLIRSATNPFVPNEIASMRREIRLFPKKPKADEPFSYICSYRFLDSAIVKRDVAQGDWLLIKKKLWKIVGMPTPETREIVLQSKVNEEEDNGSKDSEQSDLANPFVVVKIEAENAKEKNDATAQPTQADSVNIPAPNQGELEAHVDAIYFSAIDPLKYYLEVFGLYLQQLIFTYSPMAETSRDRIDIPALLNTFEIGGPTFVVNEFKSDTDNQFQEILQRYIDMIVKLNLHDAKSAYYQEAILHGDPKEQLNRDMLAKIYNDAEELYRLIWSLARATKTLEQHPQPFTSIEAVKTAAKESAVEQKIDNIDERVNNIETWIKDLVDNPIDIPIFLKRSKEYIGGRNLQKKPVPVVNP